MLHGLKVFTAESHNFTARQIGVLLEAAHTPNLTVRDAAVSLKSNKPSITRAADVLESLGLLRRAMDPADRRSVFLIPTQKGEKLVRKAQEVES